MNSEIGKRVFLAESTVKNYLSTVYQKYGIEGGCTVEKRTRAVVLAMHLGDIPFFFSHD